MYTEKAHLIETEATQTYMYVVDVCSGCTDKSRQERSLHSLNNNFLLPYNFGSSVRYEGESSVRVRFGFIP